MSPRKIHDNEQTPSLKGQQKNSLSANSKKP